MQYCISKKKNIKFPKTLLWQPWLCQIITKAAAAAPPPLHTLSIPLPNQLLLRLQTTPSWRHLRKQQIWTYTHYRNKKKTSLLLLSVDYYGKNHIYLLQNSTTATNLHCATFANSNNKKVILFNMQSIYSIIISSFVI